MVSIVRIIYVVLGNVENVRLNLGSDKKNHMSIHGLLACKYSDNLNQSAPIIDSWGLVVTVMLYFLKPTTIKYFVWPDITH